MDPYYYYCEMTAYEYPRPRPREALNSLAAVPNIIRTANAAHLHLFCDPFRTPTRHARLFYIEADSSFNAENPITPGSNIA
ncbi:MAG: hypothetical protein Q9228_001923 [Teloschistes exilis]